MICNVPNCGLELTNLRYVREINESIHLVGNCHEHNTRFINFVPNLCIPTVPSKELVKSYMREIREKEEAKQKAEWDKSHPRLL